MINRLSRSVQLLKSRMSASGIAVAFGDTASGNSTSVNLDSERFVGTITHWPESRFEFQFNRCDTGAVEVLESHEFDSDESLIAYLEELLFKRLA